MKILCADIGTGTQDILLYDSRVDIENGFKLVVPSPTMMVYRRLKALTQKGQAVVLTGLTMGGGPSQWAVEGHIEAGNQVFATADAARSFNDDLEVIREMGITVVSDEEAEALPDNVVRLELRDFDFPAIANAFGQFGVSLDDLTAVAVAVFDHGDAPPDYSDRQFRFDYIAERIKTNSQLSTFAFKGEEIPLAARLFAIVDVWDALMSDRPYRNAWSQEKVMDYIQEKTGTQFDEKVVHVFIELIQKNDDFGTD